MFILYCFQTSDAIAVTALLYTLLLMFALPFWFGLLFVFDKTHHNFVKKTIQLKFTYLS